LCIAPQYGKLKPLRGKKDQQNIVNMLAIVAF